MVNVSSAPSAAPPAAQPSRTFAELGLCRELVEACEAMGWRAPTEIQAAAIPHALEGKDLVGLGQTGSGKTGAFALPIIQALLDDRRPFFALVLSPTIELAIQIAEQFEALGSAIGLVCAVLVGGVDRMKQVISLAKRPHIVVATLGRLLDHLTDTKGFSLKNLKYLVLDEADQLLDVQFEKTFDDIMNVIPKERRTFLFSATMTAKVNKLKRACFRNPVMVSDCGNSVTDKVTSKYSTVNTLKQEFYFVPVHYKDCYLIHVLNEMRGSMIMMFVRTCESTRLLALTLRNLGFKAISISGQMSQDKRLGSLNRFKTKDCDILVCTDVASRGLDIHGVDVVINYDIPTNPKDYVHRVGRTAWAGLSGYAVSLVNQCEVEYFKLIEQQLFGGERKIDKREVDSDEIMILREGVTDAKRIALTEMKESGGYKRRKTGDDDREAEDRTTYYRKSKSLKRSRRR